MKNIRCESVERAKNVIVQAMPASSLPLLNMAHLLPQRRQSAATRAMINLLTADA
ncbi:hypothetical protein JJQ50_23210 [Enterobacter cloacae]|uniref:hypothetical protein n=1 Tax=Enterobacter TaxID=547 RepID=UPI00130096BD|nr:MULTISPECIES: hypothetical protein [Enterobacter]MBJ6384299.1 hypothetical protein [Enterobacter cloacae]MBJ6405085.1 hypothetical protein [Enterobacter cloacae]MBJ6432340.1 hypothetical protein [Enterobacter cloacae]MBJ6458750.1 hypothetical protein [Enterobacter cloacae]MBJ6485445.1 hypothetical protein [Enterobacter cloacae]